MLTRGDPLALKLNIDVLMEGHQKIVLPKQAGQQSLIRKLLSACKGCIPDERSLYNSETNRIPVVVPSSYTSH